MVLTPTLPPLGCMWQCCGHRPKSPQSDLGTEAQTPAAAARPQRVPYPQPNLPTRGPPQHPLQLPHRSQWPQGSCLHLTPPVCSAFTRCDVWETGQPGPASSATSQAGSVHARHLLPCACVPLTVTEEWNHSKPQGAKADQWHSSYSSAPEGAPV